MSNTDKLREFAERWSQTWNDNKGWIKDSRNLRLMLSDLTALISENYVEKAKYDEAVRQRDELREALQQIAECKGAYSMDRLEHATNVIKEAKAIAEAAIKSTER